MCKKIKLILFACIFFKHINMSHQESHRQIGDLVTSIKIKRDLEELIYGVTRYIINGKNINCLAIICDSVYLNIFQGFWFENIKNVSFIMITVKESEDLLSPNYETLESIRQVRRDGCRFYIILISNGIQVSRLLKFGDRYRIIDTRAKFLMLHDTRLFGSEFHYIWKRIVNVIFIRHFKGKIITKHNASSWFELSTVPFPSPIRNVLVPKRIQVWKTNNVFTPSQLIVDKTSDLKGHNLLVVAFQHIPAVVKENPSKGKLNNQLFSGMEIQIMRALASKMNFKPKLFEPFNANVEQWGHKQVNGSFSGLLGEMVNGKADMALGNLHYTPYHLQLTDLTIPYISECLTFLTPESQTDNSWKTLILPFQLNMWIAVVIVLLLSGFIFYSLAKFHKSIDEDLNNHFISSENNDGNKKYSRKSNLIGSKRKIKKSTGLFLFGELINSILYTFGMLLVVSLPKLPSGWSLRLLTGWYWLYCVLVVVAYRASMTAILANPAPRVTIDTLQQLADSKILCGGWGVQTRDFFLTSLDEVGQKIGNKFEEISDAEKGVRRVKSGDFAYYENIYYLKYLRVKQENMKRKELSTERGNENNQTNENETKLIGNRNLHIMKECVINMPISIGLQKNSPLKPKIDKLLRKIIEAGLVDKWLNDGMVPIYSNITFDEENFKALMNLKKLYAGLVTMAIGHSLGLFVFFGEIVYWKYVVEKDPNFDIYKKDQYYSRK